MDAGRRDKRAGLLPDDSSISCHFLSARAPDLAHAILCQ
jgi:hypothetical protein